MARKKWTPQTDPSSTVLKLREKRKWQINLRRYVINSQSCPLYAPYFGIDSQNFRKWIELQLSSELSWGDFGVKWQFDHVIPVAYFDFSIDAELKLCWNFTNISVSLLNKQQGTVFQPDLLKAREFFLRLYENTFLPVCREMLDKIDSIQTNDLNIEKQEAFIIENRPYLDTIKNYSVFEFELLNSGRPIPEVIKEINFLKNMED